MISRIKEIITYSGLSDRAFALRCGLAQNTLNRQLNGVRELSLSTVNAILNTFTDISSEWLLRGKGQMLLSEVNNDAQNIERVTRLADTIANLQGTINQVSHPSLYVCIAQIGVILCQCGIILVGL